ncbi:unnamed protein product [Orchesella dallaii]|uniref:F-box domain-containing protein n=1 Tax=Orchesella dallaii TaxID=48710 RepID=A0ABP1R0I5_9HEXA
MSKRLRSHTVGSVSKHGNQAVQLQLQSSFSNSVLDETTPKNVNVVMEGGGGVNGYNLDGFNLPEHVVETILSYVSDQDIPNCRVVCHTWKHLLSSKSLWKLRFQKRGVEWNEIQSFITGRDSTNMWALLHSHMCHGILHKNFISNPSGHNGFEGWDMDVAGRENQWIIEEQPVTCSPLPNAPLFGRVDQCCFATRFGVKNFMVDLWDEGLTPALTKLLLPFQIKCSQLFSTRMDQQYNGWANWNIFLLTDDQNTIIRQLGGHIRVNFSIRSTGEWQKREWVFKFERDDLSIRDLETMRYVEFLHHGMCETEHMIEEEADNGGFKFSHTCVTIEGLPDEQTPAGLGPIIHSQIHGRRGTLRSSFRV